MEEYCRPRASGRRRRRPRGKRWSSSIGWPPTGGAHPPSYGLPVWKPLPLASRTGARTKKLRSSTMRLTRSTTPHSAPATRTQWPPSHNSLDSSRRQAGSTMPPRSSDASSASRRSTRTRGKGTSSPRKPGGTSRTSSAAAPTPPPPPSRTSSPAPTSPTPARCAARAARRAPSSTPARRAASCRTAPRRARRWTGSAGTRRRARRRGLRGRGRRMRGREGAGRMPHHIWGAARGGRSLARGAGACRIMFRLAMDCTHGDSPPCPFHQGGGVAQGLRWHQAPKQRL
mmetsp:Transcript_39586/g.126356  ORF Transcript_39586/g.126356 Transcript_39586/m.126356 type:complete len:286 (+) Transcript_39586:1254-2111(+)